MGIVWGTRWGTSIPAVLRPVVASGQRKGIVVQNTWFSDFLRALNHMYESNFVFQYVYDGPNPTYRPPRPGAMKLAACRHWPTWRNAGLDEPGLVCVFRASAMLPIVAHTWQGCRGFYRGLEDHAQRRLRDHLDRGARAPSDLPLRLPGARVAGPSGTTRRRGSARSTTSAATGTAHLLRKLCDYASRGYPTCALDLGCSATQLAERYGGNFISVSGRQEVDALMTSTLEAGPGSRVRVGARAKRVMSGM